LLEEPQTSEFSQMGEVEEDATEELELGNLEWLRRENVGVGGSELSDAIQYRFDWLESSANAVTSSLVVRVANLRGLMSSRMVFYCGYCGELL
jgi:hypothetical protein